MLVLDRRPSQSDAVFMRKADPLVALVAGITLLFVPLAMIKFVLAVYLIVIGVLGCLHHVRSPAFT